MSDEKKSAAAAIKKLMGLGSSLFSRGFNPSKCKTEAKLATARIKLLRNRREAQVRQMRRDIAALIESGRDDTARIRVEHVIREQNIMTANEIIELFCELIVVRLPIIAKQRLCPADLKEGIASLIYAAPRCSDVPELQRIRDIFEKKYGKDFVCAATELRPGSGVNRMLIEKLSVRKPAGEVKLKIMKEIAKEYQVDWDTTESEQELLKPPEELLDGPRSFVEASSMPVKPTLMREINPKNHNFREEPVMQYKDTASAAQAAAESAEIAVSAAQAAAYLAKESSNRSQANSSEALANGLNNSNKNSASRRQSFNSSGQYVASETGRVFSSQSFNGSNYMNDENMETVSFDDPKTFRRNSCTTHRYSDIKFDDSDRMHHEDIETDNSINKKNSTGDRGNMSGASRRQSLNSSGQSADNEPSVNEYKPSGRFFNSQSFNGPNHRNDEDEDMETDSFDDKKILRRNSCVARTPRSDIKFDDSDGIDSDTDVENGTEAVSTRTEAVSTRSNPHPPPNRPPPVRPPPVRRSNERCTSEDRSPNTAAHVHPKLPDYEELAARFEALKSRKF